MFSWTSVISVQLSCSVIADSATPWTAAGEAPLSTPNSRSLLKLTSIESMIPSNHLTLCRPPSPPTFNLSKHQGLFKWLSSLHQVAKVLTGVAASASVLPVKIQDWFPLGWTGWISLLHSKKQKKFFVIRTFRIYYLNNIYLYMHKTHSSIHYINHVVPYIPSTYLSCNC